MATDIHPTAIVDPKAELGDGVRVGPFCIVGPKVAIGARTELVNHVNVSGRTSIGEDCRVFPYAYLGQEPQDLKYKGEDTGTSIGSRNVIREGVTIHRGSVGGDGMTTVGDDNFLMAYVHIAHDCHVGNRTIMANNVGMAGHATIEDNVIMGAYVGIHQFTRIGKYCMLGAMSKITMDVTPYMIASGMDDCKLYGPNLIGLKRSGLSSDAISAIKGTYRIIFRKGLKLEDALDAAMKEYPASPETAHMVEFIRGSRRGVLR